MTGSTAEHVRDAAFQVAVLLVAVAVWKLLTANADSLYFPEPDKVLQAVWTDWLMDWSSTWSANVSPSLQRLLGGYLVAAVIGIGAGVAIGRSRTLGDYVEPIVHFVRAIPPPALIPLFIILFGIDDSGKIALIATGVLPPILLNTIDGMRSIDPLYFDTADAFRISRRRRFTHVILPATAPKVFAGLRISMSIAVILMVISEMLGATDGIGFRVLRAQRQFKMVDLWAGLVVLGLLGTILNGALTLVERRVLRWTRQ